MNDKFTISNLDKTLFVHILIIVITQCFDNKIYPIYCPKKNINNSSINLTNTMWQGSGIQGYAIALIHTSIQNYFIYYTIYLFYCYIL